MREDGEWRCGGGSGVEGWGRESGGVREGGGWRKVGSGGACMKGCERWGAEVLKKEGVECE